MVDDFKETEFSRHCRAFAFMNSETDRMYRTCTSSSQKKVPEMSKGSRCKVLSLPKKVIAIDSCWEDEKYQGFQESDTRYINYNTGQVLCLANTNTRHLTLSLSLSLGFSLSEYKFLLAERGGGSGNENKNDQNN